MKPADIANSYNQLAELWHTYDFSDNGMAQHERAIAFLNDKRTALDIGCGSSGRIIDLLIKHAFSVEGVDLSPKMLELARQRHPQVTFGQADICQWNLPRRYDLISAWDSVWHVPLASQEAVLRKMLAGLAPGGVCIFTTPGVDGPTEKIDFAMGPPMYYCGLGIPETLRVIGESGCLCRHLEYDQYPELHLFLIAQRPI